MALNILNEYQHIINYESRELGYDDKNIHESFDMSILAAIKRDIIDKFTLDVNFIHYDSLHNLYRKLRHPLTSTHSAGEKHYFDSLAYYPQLADELSLTNVYTPAENQHITAAVAADNQLDNSSIVLNTKFLAEYVPESTRWTLYSLATVPLITYDDQTAFSVLALIKIEYPIPLSGEQLPWIMNTEHLDVLKFSACIVPDAGIYGILNFMTSTKSLLHIQRIQDAILREYQTVAHHFKYTATDLLRAFGVPGYYDKRAQHIATQQINNLVTRQYKLGKHSVGGKLMKPISVTSLSPSETQSLGSFFARSLNRKLSVIRRQARSSRKPHHAANMHIATARELATDIICKPKMKTHRGLIEFKRALTICDTFVGDHILAITSDQTSSYFDQQTYHMLSKSIDHDLFTSTNVITPDLTRYTYNTYGVGFQSRDIIQMGKRRFGQLWFCLTNKTNRWIVPLTIHYVVIKHPDYYEFAPFMMSASTQFSYVGNVIPDTANGRSIYSFKILSLTDRPVPPQTSKNVRQSIREILKLFADQRVKIYIRSDNERAIVNQLYTND